MDSISVLMCVYNKDDDQHFIEAINSLKRNTFYIDQTIIVINGYISEIKSKTINENLKDLKITRIDLPINIGLSRALNLGLQKVESKWIARFDSDDICHPDRFKIIKEIINTKGKYFDVFGTYIEEFNLFDKTKNLRKVPLSNNKIKKRILFSNPLNHVSVFFRQSLFEESEDENFYPLIDGFEDYALWIKLINQNAKITNIPKVTVLVRADEKMLIRRGGLNYIIREIKFRRFVLNYIPINQYPSNLIFCILRIITFTTPIFLKKILYKIKRSYFDE